VNPRRADGPRRVALIGFGALGQAIAAELEAGQLPGVTLAGALLARGGERPKLPCAWNSIDDLLAAAPDLVIEVAGHTALQAHAGACLRAGHDVLAASVGALMHEQLRESLWAAARAGNSRLLVPSGALGGLDYLRAARRIGPVEVRYRGRKPVAAWKGTAAETMIDLDAVRAATTFFRGHAAEAATRFPQNANVVAALALAVGSPDAVAVELVADPQAPRNVHEVEARGAAGTIRLSVENEAMPGNPKSSRVTAFSVLDTVATSLGAQAC
jgi:aspartate dehydrogenase